LLHFNFTIRLTRLEAMNMLIPEPKQIDELKDQDCK